MTTGQEHRRILDHNRYMANRDFRKAKQREYYRTHKEAIKAHRRAKLLMLWELRGKGITNNKKSITDTTMANRTISKRDAAKMFGVTTQTITNWVERGLLTAHSASGNRKKITASSADALLHRCADIPVTAKDMEEYKAAMRQQRAELEAQLKGLKEDYAVRVADLKAKFGFLDNIALVRDYLLVAFETMEKSAKIDYRTHDIIKEFLTVGGGIADIADKNGISCKRVWQILEKGVVSLQKARRYSDIAEENEKLKSDNNALRAQITILQREYAKATSWEKDIVGKEQLGKLPIGALADEISGTLLACTIKAEYFGFSSRAVNILRGAGITIFAELAHITEDELKKQRNMGNKSFYEIYNALELYGLHLGMTTEELVNVARLWKSQE